MTGRTARLERRACRARTAWTMSASTALHALLLAAVALAPRHAPGSAAITEIALLDEPGDAGAPAGEPGAAPAAAAAASGPEETPGLAAAHPADARFRRQAPAADVAPEPQTDLVLEDRLEARLAALKREAVKPAAGGLAPASEASLWGASLGAGAGAGAGAGGSTPVALRRGGAGGGGQGPGFALVRGSGAGALAELAAPPAAPPERRAAAEPAGGGDATARRTLAGASLLGPIADRPIVSYATPIYPEWAKREAVEGSVTLYFVVLPDGSVKDNVMVQKTAGFEDFDESARAALHDWRFEPLPQGRTGEQWGTITFHFRLRDAAR